MSFTLLSPETCDGRRCDLKDFVIGTCLVIKAQATAVRRRRSEPSLRPRLCWQQCCEHGRVRFTTVPPLSAAGRVGREPYFVTCSHLPISSNPKRKADTITAFPISRFTACPPSPRDGSSGRCLNARGWGGSPEQQPPQPRCPQVWAGCRLRSPGANGAVSESIISQP